MTGALTLLAYSRPVITAVCLAGGSGSHLVTATASAGRPAERQDHFKQILVVSGVITPGNDKDFEKMIFK
jgi:hypothetical protein